MNNRKFINFLSYIAVFVIASLFIIAYLSKKFLNLEWDVSDLCYKVAFYNATLVTIFSALYYASTKRNTLYMFLLILIIVALVIFMFVL